MSDERPDAPTPAPAEPGGLFALVVDRPVAMTMIFLAAMVFGFVSYQRLPIELMPDVSYPTITVRTVYEGAAPQEVESQISEPIEEALATLDGLVTLESRSRAGTSDVVLGFDWDTDMAAAAQAIREALQVTTLPKDVERPLLLRYDPSLDPFLRLGLSYDPAATKLPPDQALFLVREVADEQVRRKLEAMAGVAAVRVKGGLERELRVEVRQDWLAARKLTLAQVRDALAAENVNLAGGTVLEGDTEYLVRTVNELHGLEDLAALRLRRADGVLVPLTDVAVLSERPKERTVVSHLDGAEAVELEVFKEADANIVDVARRVKETLLGTEPPVDAATFEAMEPGPAKDAVKAALEAAEGLKGELPAGVKIAVLDDQAVFIEDAIANLRESVVLGGALSIIVLFAFLRDFRSTGIISLAIPVSLLVGFAPLWLGGVTLNLMSLGGLALGVGMLVDTAVVVLEAIQVRLDAGEERRSAAILGTSEVALAVTSSTLTNIAVFVPIGLVEGVGGEMFWDLSLAVVGSTVASLLVALFLVPTLAARAPAEALDARAIPALALRATVAPALAAWAEDLAWARAKPARLALLPWSGLRLVLTVLTAGLVELGRWAILRGLAALRWALGFVTRPLAKASYAAAEAFLAVFDRFAGAYQRAMLRVLVRPGVVLVVAAVLFAGVLQLAGGLGSELLPEVHQGRFTLEVALPVGTPLARTAEVVGEAERLVRANADVASVFTTIGSDGRAEAKSDEGEHAARMRVQLTPGELLGGREERVMDELRAALADTGLSLRITRPSLFSFRTPLEAVVHGQDLDRLRGVGEQVAAALSAAPGVTDVQTSLASGHPEVQIAYDRARLARFGLDTATVAQRVRDLVQGVEATEVRRADRRLDLRVQLVDDQRGSLDDLKRLNVNPAVDPPIPLAAVATFTEAVGPSEIRRVDQQRAVVVSANVEGFDMGTAIASLRSVLVSAALEDDMSWELGGQARELGGAMSSLGLALGLAVFLVYVIMACTFESVVQPLVILFTVPLGLIGVVGGLALWGMPISVVAVLGVIVLAGIVVNNAIVLVDAINRLRDDGRPRVVAIREAAATRLRPILITTVCSVLGLVPLAFGYGAGAEVQQPMAVTVMCGMTAATLLTLVVIPAIYLLATGGREGPAAPVAPADEQAA